MNTFYLFKFFFLFFRPRRAACGILVPQPGIKPMPLQWKRVVLTTGPPGKSLHFIFYEQF